MTKIEKVALFNKERARNMKCLKNMNTKFMTPEEKEQNLASINQMKQNRGLTYLQLQNINKKETKIEPEKSVNPNDGKLNFKHGFSTDFQVFTYALYVNKIIFFSSKKNAAFREFKNIFNFQILGIDELKEAYKIRKAYFLELIRSKFGRKE